MNAKPEFGPLWVVLIAVTDPAIDQPKMSEKIQCADGKERTLFEVYSVTRDESLLRLKDGAQPTRFKLLPLRQRTANRLVEDLENPTGDELWSLTAASLVEVDDPNDLIKLDPNNDFQRPDGDGRIALRPEAFERVAATIGVKAIRELGYVLLQRAALPLWAIRPFVLARG